MANLTMKDKAILEGLFSMDTGYVLNFSNATFARFVGESVNIDIYGGDGYTDPCSKANKLRQIWKQENDAIVGKLLQDLIQHYEILKINRDGELSEKEKGTLTEMRLVAQRLLGTKMDVPLPQKQEDTLQTLLEDINHALAINKPSLVLDRLHTFSTKLLRGICHDNGIRVVGNRGEYLPLHSLAGMLKKHYEQSNIFQSSFTIIAIQNTIMLFDRYNAIRNDQSYAHDNEVLDEIEAEFVVRTIANVITFIDKAETYRKTATVRDIT